MIFSPVGDSCLMEETTAHLPSAICSVTMLTLHSASTGMCFRSTIVRSSRVGGRPPTLEVHSAGQRLLGFGRPVGVILDAEGLHFRELLAPCGLLLVTAAPLGDLVPLGCRGVERLLGRLALGQGLRDLER